MSDYRTSEDESYDWDYEEESRGGRILWGRVLALAAFLVVAFFVGRLTASEGIAEERFDAVRQELAEARTEIDRLESAQAVPTPALTPTPTPTDEGTDVEAETYIVGRGDTLRGIAGDFYGDAALDDCIAEANGITEPEQLSVGQELVIPPEDTC